MNAETVACSAWIGISARTKLAMQKAAAGWGLEIISARWDRIRKGGIMCYPEGGWVAEVRACGGKHREVALGYTLAEVLALAQELARGDSANAEICGDAGKALPKQDKTL